jgi:hypothetical protein
VIAIFARWSVLAVPLLVLAGCSPPLSEPENDEGYARNGRARGFIDAQLAPGPRGTEPDLNGDEAEVIYRNYLRSIGREISGGGHQALGAGSDEVQGSGGMGDVVGSFGGAYP